MLTFILADPRHQAETKIEEGIWQLNRQILNPVPAQYLQEKSAPDNLHSVPKCSKISSVEYGKAESKGVKVFFPC